MTYGAACGANVVVGIQKNIGEGFAGCRKSAGRPVFCRRQILRKRLFMNPAMQFLGLMMNMFIPQTLAAVPT